MTDVKNDIPETTEDGVDVSRRRALARLGLTAAAAYAAPALLPLTQAAASPSSGGSSSGTGGSSSSGPSGSSSGSSSSGPSGSSSSSGSGSTLPTEPTVATEPSDSSS